MKSITPLTFLSVLAILGITIFVDKPENQIPENEPTYKRRLIALKSSGIAAQVCQNLNVNFYLEALQPTSTSTSVENFIKNTRGDNKLQQYLDDQIDLKTYAFSYLPWTVPQVVLLALTAIFLFFYLVCLCACCPPSCCKRDPEKNPYSKCDRKYHGFIGFVIGIALITFAGIGIKFNQEFIDSIRDTNCSLMATLEHFFSGMDLQDGNQWIGVQNLGDTLLNIGDQLVAKKQDILNTFNQTAWLDNEKAALESSLDNIYMNNKNAVVSSPYPKDTVTKLVPIIIQNLGPKTIPITNLGRLQIEYQLTTGAVSQALIAFRDSSNLIANEADNIKTQLDNGRQQVYNLNQNFMSYNDNAGSIGDKSNTYSGQLYKIIIALFAVYLFAALFGVVGSLFVTYLELKKLRFLFHVSWVFLSLIAIFGFLICLITLPLTVALLEGCQMMDNTFLNATMFENSSLIPNSSVDLKSKVQVCLFGDGDLASVLNVRSKIDQIFNVSDNKNNLLNTSTKTYNLSYQDSGNRFSAQIQNNIEFVDTAVPNPPSISPTPNSNPEYMNSPLQQLADWNAYTSIAKNLPVPTHIGQCTNANGGPTDQYVFNLTNCTDSGTVVSNRFSSGLDPSSFFGQPTCIQLQDIQVSSFYIRTDLQKPCDQYNLLSMPSIGANNLGEVSQAYQAQLNLYTSDVKTTLGQLKADVDAYNVQNAAFKQQLDAMKISSTQQIQTAIQSVLDLVSAPKTGLMAGLNCTFLKYSFNSFRQATCVNFLPSFFYFSVILGICSTLAFGLAFFNYLAASRCLVHFEDERTKRRYEDIQSGRGAKDNAKMKNSDDNDDDVQNILAMGLVGGSGIAQGLNLNNDNNNIIMNQFNDVNQQGLQYDNNMKLSNFDEANNQPQYFDEQIKSEANAEYNKPN